MPQAILPLIADGATLITDKLNVVNPAWRRLEQDRRSLQGKLNTRDMFLSEADILPDTDNKTLNVCLHYTAEARHNRAIEHLLQHLNDVEYKYPGTELILRFSLGTPELPAPVG